MSSLVSGVGKIFTSFAPVAATIGSAIRGVGASLFTAGAATGASAVGGASSGIFGGGILSRMFSGVASVLSPTAAGLGSVASATGAAGATGVGGLGTALGDSFTGPWGLNPAAGEAAKGGGLFPTAATATGFAAAGPSAGTGGFLDKVGGFMNSDAGQGIMGALGGYGEATLEAQKLQSQEDINAAQIAYHQKQADDIRNSYNVPGSALVGGTTRVAAAAPRVVAKEMWWHNPATGAIEKKAA